MNDTDDPSGEQRVDERMAQMESRWTFLEHTVDVLSGELEAQQNEVRILRAKLERLNHKLESLQHDTGIGDQHDEPPPHY